MNGLCVRGSNASKPAKRISLWSAHSELDELKGLSQQHAKVCGVLLPLSVAVSSMGMKSGSTRDKDKG